MLNTVRAVMKEGKIQPLEDVDIPEGTEMLVTLLDDAELDTAFWTKASRTSLEVIWKNSEDDVYAQLLET